MLTQKRTERTARELTSTVLMPGWLSSVVTCCVREVSCDLGCDPGCDVLAATAGVSFSSDRAADCCSALADSASGSPELLLAGVSSTRAVASGIAMTSRPYLLQYSHRDRERALSARRRALELHRELAELSAQGARAAAELRRCLAGRIGLAPRSVSVGVFKLRDRTLREVRPSPYRKVKGAIHPRRG